MNDCDGCVEKDSCPIQDARGEDLCPCRTCLVRVMCEEGCVEWDKIYENNKIEKMI
jgi:hypothetical protein